MRRVYAVPWVNPGSEDDPAEVLRDAGLDPLRVDLDPPEGFPDLGVPAFGPAEVLRPRVKDERVEVVCLLGGDSRARQAARDLADCLAGADVSVSLIPAEVRNLFGMDGWIEVLGRQIPEPVPVRDPVPWVRKGDPIEVPEDEDRGSSPDAPAAPETAPEVEQVPEDDPEVEDPEAITRERTRSPASTEPQKRKSPRTNLGHWSKLWKPLHRSTRFHRLSEGARLLFYALLPFPEDLDGRVTEDGIPLDLQDVAFEIRKDPETTRGLLNEFGAAGYIESGEDGSIIITGFQQSQQAPSTKRNHERKDKQ